MTAQKPETVNPKKEFDDSCVYSPLNGKIVKLEEVSREEPEGFAGEDNTFMTGDRAFVSTGERNHRYVPIAVALTNDEWKANLLKDAKKDMQAFITKYHRLAELANIIDNMNKFLSA